MSDDTARQQADNEKALGEAHGQTELVTAAEKRTAALNAADATGSATAEPPVEPKTPRAARQTKR